MLLSHLKVSGLLSFGPEGLDLPLRPLNVLIGPNGSGKSNLLEVLSLLKAAPTKLSGPIKAAGGIEEWLWKGGTPIANGRDGKPEFTSVDHRQDGNAAFIEAGVAHVMTTGGEAGLMYRHSLKLGANAGRFELLEETITDARPEPPEREPWWYYRLQNGLARVNKARPLSLDDLLTDGGDEMIRVIPRAEMDPEKSILAQMRDPVRYQFLVYLEGHYSRIQLYRNWSFGPDARFRQGSRIEDADDFLYDGGENLAAVVDRISADSAAFEEFKEALRQVYDGLKDVRVGRQGGRLQVYIIEEGGRQIAATRLSDGTLRYLCLLAILLHPRLPPLIAIEEPELGLHPDLVPRLADLLKKTSERTQLVVTTHSHTLVDALGDEPESVVVCEKVEGQSRFERLDGEHLAKWLEKYSLGKLWSMGQIGGNRW